MTLLSFNISVHQGAVSCSSVVQMYVTLCVDPDRVYHAGERRQLHSIDYSAVLAQLNYISSVLYNVVMYNIYIVVIYNLI